MKFSSLFRKNQPLPDVLDSRSGKLGDAPRVLVLSASKKNQNFYRDKELVCQSRGLMLTEAYDFAAVDWSVSRVVERYFPDGVDYIFLNYNHGYSYRLCDFQQVGAPLFAFVGDHYDFTAERESARIKQAFIRELDIAAMMSAYPHTNDEVRRGLGRQELDFLTLHWAVDPSVFCDLGKRRKYDIACIGAHTESKYPFRRQVRGYLEEQRPLKFFKKQRVCGHDGELFNQTLNKMRASFSCASIFGYTLMKYFEIPASGALLFGERT